MYDELDCYKLCIAILIIVALLLIIMRMILLGPSTGVTLLDIPFIVGLVGILIAVIFITVDCFMSSRQRQSICKVDKQIEHEPLIIYQNLDMSSQDELSVEDVESECYFIFIPFTEIELKKIRKDCKIV